MLLSHRRFSAAIRGTFAGFAVALAIAAPAGASPQPVGSRVLTHRMTGPDVAVQQDFRTCSRHSKRRNRRTVKAVRRRACHPNLSHDGKPDAHAVDGGLIVGLNSGASGWGGASTADRLDQIVSQSGTKWLREGLLWSRIEPAPGKFSFSYYDHFVLLAAERGVRILPLLWEPPAWAEPSPIAIPSDPSGYAAYVAAVVNRYGPHGSFWTEHPRLRTFAIKTFELWNEPYYDNGNDGNYDPARYARLIKAAGSAGHTADPSARFLIAAENEAQLVGSTWVWWVDALYQAVPDLNNYFDGVAVHPYGDDLSSLSYPTPGVAYDGYNQLRRLESIRQEFVNHGASDKPLWLTEIGWPTCTSGSIRCTTEAGQAADLTTTFNDARTTWKSYVQAVFVYDYQDNASNSADTENDYGLVYYNGTPKAALNVFKAQPK